MENSRQSVVQQNMRHCTTKCIFAVFCSYTSGKSPRSVVATRWNKEAQVDDLAYPDVPTL